MKQKLVSHFFFSCLFIALFASWASAQTTAIPLNPNVRVGKLPNGMKYYIQKNAKPEKRAELRLAINAGSVCEDDTQLGLAHLVEHMAFNGTKNFPKNDLVHYLQSVGVSFGPEINAYTSFDETVYMLTIPSDSANILDNGIKIMADWAYQVTFDSVEVKKERGVVLEEWRLGRGAGQRMSDKYFPVLLKDSKYAKRLPIGTKESIEGASLDVLKKFYQDWYRPDLAAFIVVGDINPDEVEKKIKTYFSSFTNPTASRVRESFPIPDNKEPLISVVSDKENPYNSFSIIFKNDHEKYQTMDDYRRQYSYNIFTGMFNQRLNELLQDSNPPFLYAYSYYGSFLRSKNAYQLGAQVSETGFEKGLKTVLLENERVKRFGFTKSEFERYKKTLLKSLENAYNERDKTESGNLVQQYVSHFLTNDPAPGIEFEYKFVKENIDKIPLEEINKLAGRWIKDKNQLFIVTSVEKEGVKLPTEADIKQIIKGIATEKITPYKENAIASDIMPVKPSAGKIVSEKKIEDLGVTELVLSNGIRVTLKPTDFKNDEILMNAQSYGGQSKFPESYYMSAQYASSIVQESGIATFSKTDLSKTLAGKTVNVSPWIGTYSQGVSGSSSIADLETMFKLIHLNFTQPRRDEKAFQSYISRQKDAYKNVLTDPTSFFFNQVRNIRYNNNPRMKSIPSDQDWDQIKLDQVFEVYKESFKNASGFDFYFVGSFQPDAIKPLLETYLGSLPTTGEKAAYVDLGIRAIKGPMEQKIIKGNDPKSFASIYLEGKGEFSKEESHRMWTLGNILNRIYLDKLREEMSGIYGLRVTVDMECTPYPYYWLEITLPCSPDNVDTLVAAAFAEIENIKKNGVPEKELQKELESQRRTVEEDMKRNSGWMWRLQRLKTYQEDYTRLRKPEDIHKVITSKDLQMVANKYLDLSKCLKVTLYPKTSSAAGGSK
ncbi:MAG: insulinase family protein [Bacteroidota bacterium]